MMSISTDTVREVEDLPCWRCQDPRGADIRHALAQTGGIVDERQGSPVSRLPLGEGLTRMREGTVLYRSDVTARSTLGQRSAATKRNGLGKEVESTRRVSPNI
jgi:hypothetical protein